MNLAVGQSVQLQYKSFSLETRRMVEVVKTIKGKVMASPKWLTADQIAIATGNPEFPVAVLQKKNIVGLESAKQDKFFRSFTVRSKDKTYKVLLSNGRYSCDCVGFGYRKTCKHVVAVSHKVEKSG